MSLIIAVIGIIVFLAIVIPESAKSSAYDREMNQMRASKEAFKEMYSDLEFESQLLHAITSSDNYDAVYAEVLPILEKTEYWNHFTQETLKPWALDNRDIILDIMLANRGKVSYLSCTFGYTANIAYNDHFEPKEKMFEYVELLQSLLKKRGVHLGLIYYRKISGFKDEGYAWNGSGKALDARDDSAYTTMPFSKDLLSLKSEIPPIPNVVSVQPLLNSSGSDVVTYSHLEEVNIRKRMDDPYHYQGLCERVLPVLEQTKYWKPSLLVSFCITESQARNWSSHHVTKEDVQRNREIMTDILLAQKGFVSALAYSCGHKAYLTSQSQEEREKAFEYVEMLQTLLRKKHPNATYVYIDAGFGGRYVIQGGGSCYSSTYTEVPFDRSLLGNGYDPTAPQS